MAVTVDAKCCCLTEISRSTAQPAKRHTNLTVGASATALLASLCFDGRRHSQLNRHALGRDGTNVAMTQIGTTTYVAGVGQIALFGLVNPVAGAKTLKATWTGTGTGYMASMSFIGTNTSTVATASPTSSPPRRPALPARSTSRVPRATMRLRSIGNDNVTYTTFIHATSSTALLHRRQ